MDERVKLTSRARKNKANLAGLLAVGASRILYNLAACDTHLTLKKKGRNKVQESKS